MKDEAVEQQLAQLRKDDRALKRGDVQPYKPSWSSSAGIAASRDPVIRANHLLPLSMRRRASQNVSLFRLAGACPSITSPIRFAS